MTADRLKALTDGVIAVLVLDIKPPHGATPHDLLADAPTFLAYVLSFLYVAIYWNNNHHFFALPPEVDGLVLWANVALLFCLSLTPAGTAWMGDEALRPWPTAVYGATS